jgi:hypothetical protein
MTANIRGVAVCPHNIDTDAALMSLQPKLKAAGDRTFSPVLHINIGMCQTTDVSCMMFYNKIGLY